MNRISPLVRISLGLVLLTISILLVSDMLGLLPSRNEGLLDGRKKVCESLAVLFSTAAQANDLSLASQGISAAVARNDDILSAAVRTNDGKVLLMAGDHDRHWGGFSDDSSTPTHVMVPVFKGEEQWGSVEVRFTGFDTGNLLEYLRNSTVGLLMFVGISGFLGYFMMIRKTFTVLNPTGAVPDRVKAAFDALAEGVLLLDEKQLIILANNAFIEKTDLAQNKLVGKDPANIGWQQRRAQDGEDNLPWKKALKDGKTQTGCSLTLETSSGMKTFIANCTPILDGEGNSRGALVSFDDVTALEKKNVNLRKTLGKLKKSQEIITRQNEELQFLVARDPLTGSLNRRAFFEEFEVAFSEAKKNKTLISCIMVDIDHFKAVNDNHGHAMGDDVIKLVANVLETSSRNDDRAGRYGGEEFCVFLPETDIEQATVVAEKIRTTIHTKAKEKYKATLRITASLGVACLNDNAATPGELINQADNALYVAKETGRNRVIQFNEDDAKAVSAQPEEQQNIAEEAALFETVETSEQPDSEEVKVLKQRVLELECVVDKHARELEYKSGHDELTELPNRLLLHDRIEQALVRAKRFHSIFAVLSVDIGMFKRISNTLGHVVGDELLKRVSERLADTLRELDTVAMLDKDKSDHTVSRIAGDEFGVLLADLDKIESVTWIVKRIIEVLTEQMEIDGHTIFVTCNIGVSLYPNDGETAESLIRSASSARHHAKQQLGRNHYQFYSDEINDASLRQLQLETELRHAIERNEFVLHYQPKVELSTGKICGVEALIRWQSPKRGLMSPYSFISVAEQTGLISEIGEWVFETACQQLKTWLDMGVVDVKVAVNLSTVQLRQSDLASRLLSIAEASDVPFQRIELEVTESVIMQNVNTAVDTIQALHDAGIKISMDDFGTGYSSLSYLKRLPIDTVKLDRSFISEIASDSHDAAIVSSIIELSHSMGLTVIAEGVETEEQLALIRSLKCDELQGYLFSKPVASEDATALLVEGASMTLV